MSSFVVLWVNRDDRKASELMNEIIQRLKAREVEQAKERVFN